MNTQPAPIRAIVYCRAQQSMRPNLEIQERRCRDFAAFKGYSVERIFSDVGSGNDPARKALGEMLAFLRNAEQAPDVLLISDVGVLARSTSLFFKLCETIRDAGCALETPQGTFGDDPASRLNKGIMASVAQYEEQAEARETEEAADAGEMMIADEDEGHGARQ